MTEEPKNVNHLYLRPDGGYGLTAIGDSGPINLTAVRPKNPGVIFRIGDKQLAFRVTDDGLIDAEYEPADLTDMAQVMVTEVRRLLNRRPPL